MEISAFKHSLKIEVDGRKDKIRTSLCPLPTPSAFSQTTAHTNRPKKRVDPTARPLPRSRSISRSHTPLPEVSPWGQSPDMVTPCASPVLVLPLTHALMEHALSLQPPPTDVSVGPLEGSFECAMLGVHTSQLTGYEYPPAPSAYEVHGPSNTAVSSLPSQLSPTDPPTSDVMAAIMALTSQVSALSSQVSTHLECLENPARSYSPSEPAALWCPTPSHLSKPDTNFQTGLPNPDILSRQVDFTWDMDEVADFKDYSTHQPKDQVSAHEAHAAQIEADQATARLIPLDVRDMWTRFEGLDPHVENLTPSQFTSLDTFYSFFDQFLAENYAPSQIPEITDEFESAFLSHYCSFLQMRSFAKVAGKQVAPAPQPALPMERAPAAGSIRLFPLRALSQPPIIAPVEPDIPWTIIGEKKKGCNQPCSFVAAVLGPTQGQPCSRNPSTVQTTNHLHNLSDQQLQNLTRDQLVTAYKTRFDCKVKTHNASKLALIIAYKCALESQSAVISAPADLSSALPAQSQRPRPCPVITTEFTVTIDPSTVALHRPRGDPAAIVRSLQTAL